MSTWSKDKVEPSNINGGNEYEIKDVLSLEAINAIVNNSFYAMDKSEEANSLAEDAVEKANEAIEKANEAGSSNVEANPSGIATETLNSIGIDGTNYKIPQITEENKLNSDLVDDTNSVHKFVTAEDKGNWNSKSVVSVSDEGTSINEVQYITIDGEEHKLAGGTTITFVRYD